eukprot:scaffold19416_cov20-Prasinocladus_malaysianus.AAC.1
MPRIVGDSGVDLGPMGHVLDAGPRRRVREVDREPRGVDVGRVVAGNHPQGVLAGLKHDTSKALKDEQSDV